MEADCVNELDEVIENAGEDLSEFDELFKDCVETEVKFYRQESGYCIFLIKRLRKVVYGLRNTASKILVLYALDEK